MEETTDPLADLPEDPTERRARVDDYLASERERIAAEAKQQAEAALQQHKAAVNAGAKQRLMDRFGIEWGDDGEFAVKDPLRALANLQGAPAPPPVEDPRPDPVYDPEGHAAWIDRQIDRKADSKVEKATAALTQQLTELRGLIVGQQVQGVEAQGREMLEGYGLGQWAEHPDFAAAYRQNLQNLPPQALRSPEALRLAAMGAVALLDPAQLPKQRETPPQDPDTGRFVSNPSRAGLTQAAPPRGYGRTDASGGGYTQEQRDQAALADLSVEEFVAMSSNETAFAYEPKGRR